MGLTPTFKRFLQSINKLSLSRFLSVPPYVKVSTFVTIRFHASHNIVLGSDGYLYILSHFGCLPNASLDWPV